MTGLLIWQGVLGYLVYGVSQLFTDFESPTNMIVFIVWTQPFIWLFMLLTVGAIVNVIRRRKFELLNSVLLVSIIAVSNIFLHILVVLSGYAPIFELSNAVGG
jgi:hypothetical protein